MTANIPNNYLKKVALNYASHKEHKNESILKKISNLVKTILMAPVTIIQNLAKGVIKKSPIQQNFFFKTNDFLTRNQSTIFKTFLVAGLAAGLIYSYPSIYKWLKSPHPLPSLLEMNFENPISETPLFCDKVESNVCHNFNLSKSKEAFESFGIATSPITQLKTCIDQTGKLVAGQDGQTVENLYQIKETRSYEDILNTLFNCLDKKDPSPFLRPDSEKPVFDTTPFIRVGALKECLDEHNISHVIPTMTEAHENSSSSVNLLSKDLKKFYIRMSESSTTALKNFLEGYPQEDRSLSFKLQIFLGRTFSKENYFVYNPIDGDFISWSFNND